MRLVLVILALVSASAMPALARVSSWILDPSGNDHGERLIYESGGQVSYRFECEKDAIAITEMGVTELLDFKTNAKVGDGPDAIMPDGAALMALYGGKGTPAFQPATAVKNPSGGWNLTIRLSKNDKQLRAVGSSTMMSLFTTGYTTAVAMDDTTRATWNSFVKRCKGLT